MWSRKASRTSTGISHWKHVNSSCKWMCHTVIQVSHSLHLHQSQRGLLRRVNSFWKDKITPLTVQYITICSSLISYSWKSGCYFAEWGMYETRRTLLHPKSDFEGWVSKYDLWRRLWEQIWFNLTRTSDPSWILQWIYTNIRRYLEVETAGVKKF